MIEKKATVHWEGRGKAGQGKISTETGALSAYPYGFASRFEGVAHFMERLMSIHTESLRSHFRLSCETLAVNR